MQIYILCLLKSSHLLCLGFISFSDLILGKSFGELFSATLTNLSKLVGITSCDDNGTSDQVPQKDGDNILENSISQGNLRSKQEGTGHDEKVGDTVFKTDSNKGRNGEPTSDEFSGKVIGGTGHEDGNRNHPVTQDSLDESYKRKIKMCEWDDKKFTTLGISRLW